MTYTIIDNIIRIKDSERYESDDTIIVESHLDVMVNGKRSADLHCSPDSLTALVYGHLLSRKMICAKDHVASLTIDEENSLALVRLAKHAHHIVTRNPDFTCSLDQIRSVAKRFIPGSENFRCTGALHSAAVCQGDDILVYKEDFSRHCAMDKALGEALLSDIRLSDCFVMTSGRVPSDMFEKVLAAGVPAIFSRSAPSETTVLLARKTNTILCGFVRDNRMNIYSGSDRIR